MFWLLLLLGLATLAIVIHGVLTGTLRVEHGVSRAHSPRTFWFVCGCLTLVALYLLWLAWHDA